MDNINEKLVKCLKSMKELEAEKKKLLESAKALGYIYDETSNKLIKDSNSVIAVDILINARTTYESSGYFVNYAGLIAIPDSLFNKIKPNISKNKKDWDDIFEDLFTENDYFNNLLNALDFLPCDNITEDEIERIILDEDKYYDKNTREGFIKLYAEVHLKSENMTGYITFFRMDKELYEKNKHEQVFTNEKYLHDNASFKYNNTANTTLLIK